MKTRRLIFLLLTLFSLFSFISCERGIKLEDIEAMPDGYAKDSTLFYYKFGFNKNTPLLAADTFGMYARPEIPSAPVTMQVGEKTILGEVLVCAGDTLIALDYKMLPSKKDEGSPIIKWKILHVAGGSSIAWHMPSVSNIAPFAWTAFLHDWDGWIGFIIIFGTLLVLLHRLWIWLYRKVQDKNGRRDSTEGLKLQYVFIGVSFLVAAMGVYLGFNSDIATNLYYNPDMVAHWSEYPFMVKLLPFLLGLFALSLIAMLVEMIIKMKSGWFIFNFIGWFALGMLVIGLTLLATWLIYILFPTLLAFFIFALMGGGGSKSSGNSSGGGGSVVGYDVSGKPIHQKGGQNVVYK